MSSFEETLGALLDAKLGRTCVPYLWRSSPCDGLFRRFSCQFGRQRRCWA